MSNILPTLKYTWEMSVNNVAGTSVSTIDSYQKSLFELKEALVNLSFFPWTVDSSSNSFTASAGDNWSVSTDLVWATPPTAHSWIVLQHPTRSTQYLFDLNTGAVNGRILGAYCDFNGNFTGGTTTARPTSPTEMIIDASTEWLGPITVAFDSWVHVWHQDNGARTRILVSTDSGAQAAGTFLLFDEIDSPSELWSSKEVVATLQTITAGSTAMSIANALVQPYDTTTNTRLFKGKISDDNYSYKAINFDGSSEYLAIGNVTELDFTHTDSFSVSTWLKTSSATSERVAISKKDTAGNQTGWSLGSDANGKIFVYLTNTATSNEIKVLSGTAINDNMWHHIVVTYDGTHDAGGVSIYIDKIKETNSVITNLLTSSISTTAPANIGSSNNGAGIEWLGLIDDTAVYDIEITQADVNIINNNNIPSDLTANGPFSSLVGYWLMGDKSDVFPTITDQSSSSNDATMTSMTEDNFISDTPGVMTLAWGCHIAEIATGTAAMVPDRTVTSVQNEIDTTFPTITDVSSSGNDATAQNMENQDLSGETPNSSSTTSLLFGGSNEYLLVGDVPELSFDHDDAFSISAWIKTTDTGNRSIIAKRLNTGTFRGWVFFTNASQIGLQLVNTTGSNVLQVQSSGISISDDVWHHVAVTYDGYDDVSGVTLYFDGSATSKAEATNSLNATILNAVNVQIAALETLFVYPGYMDDLAVYNKKLSGSEITTIYNSKVPTDLRETGPFANLIGYWRMGDDNNPPAYPMHPIFIASEDKNYRGYHGFIDDLWWGTQTFLSLPGNTYPNTVHERQFAQIGQIILPWTGDNTVPLFGGSAPTNITSNGHFVGISDNISAAGKINYYQMIGIDAGSPTQPYYHSWKVTDNPDPTGAQATGDDAPPFGGPLTNIFVSAEWLE